MEITGYTAVRLGIQDLMVEEDAHGGPSDLRELCPGGSARPGRPGRLPSLPMSRLRGQRRRHRAAERGSHAPHRLLVTDVAVVMVGLPPEEGLHVAAAGEREAREEQQQQGDPG